MLFDKGCGKYAVFPNENRCECIFFQELKPLLKKRLIQNVFRSRANDIAILATRRLKMFVLAMIHPARLMALYERV